MRALWALLLCLSPALHAAESRRFAWDEDWPKFRVSEYVVTGLATAGAAANFYLVPPPKSSSWRGPILFDAGAERSLAIHSEARINQAKKLSDILVFPLIGYSMLDGPITTGWVGGNRETAIQLALINAQTFAVNEMLNLSISNTLARRRPKGALCDPGSKYDPHCVKSFWSGHAANAFAAASLVCVQHGALDLYGATADAVSCGTSLAVASAVGVLRIASNDHYASDVIVGAAVGAATGYLMPKFMHFRSKKSGERLGFWLPHVGPNGGGLSYVRTW